MDTSAGGGAIGLATTDPDPIEPTADAPCGVPNQLLAGKYRLVREIGRGGMGSVWQADRLDWGGSPVALKLITLPDTPLTRARVRREVHAATTLRSTHVVQVLDHGVDEATGVTFIAMELLEGESLGNRLRRLHVLSPSEVMRVVSHVGRALSRAHAAGVVHRDLKPDNVYFVDNHEEPIIKVLDFGLAKAFDVSLDSRARTVPGSAVGTPRYMSPEQLRPGSGTVGPLSDLWSLAVMVFECLIGRPPFVANTLPELTLQLWAEKRPVPSELGVVPTGFDTWFAKATHPDVDARFQDVAELVAALSDICASSPMALPAVHRERGFQPRPSSLVPVTRQAETTALSRRRSAVRFSVIGAILLGITSAFVWVNRSTAVTQRPTSAAPRALTPTQPTPLPGPQSEVTPVPHRALPPAQQGDVTPAATAAPVGLSSPTVRVVPALVAPAASGIGPEPARARAKKPRKAKLVREERRPTSDTSDELAQPSAVREF
jgi:serine/threonine protein kinase